MRVRSHVAAVLRLVKQRCLAVFSAFRLILIGEGMLLIERDTSKVVYLKGGSGKVLRHAIQETGDEGKFAVSIADLSVGTRNAATRDEWVESVLLSLPNGTRLLDAGAGEMQYKKFCRHLEYVSQDLAEYNGEGNSVGLQTGQWDTSGIDIVSDICSIPVEDGSFDAVMCTEVLEHLPDPVRALQELARVLHARGRLIITAPFCSLTHFAPYHYATGFNKYFYLFHLKKLGFQDIQVVENGNYFEFLAQELRRLQLMADKYAGSQLTLEAKFSTSILLETLQKFTDHDNGSCELLHFDCQVTATKI